MPLWRKIRVAVITPQKSSGLTTVLLRSRLFAASAS
jgi:hypothetical protein